MEGSATQYQSKSAITNKERPTYEKSQIPWFGNIALMLPFSVVADSK